MALPEVGRQTGDNENTREDIFKEIDILVGMEHENVIFMKEYFEENNKASNGSIPVCIKDTMSCRLLLKAKIYDDAPDIYCEELCTTYASPFLVLLLKQSLKVYSFVMSLPSMQVYLVTELLLGGELLDAVLERGSYSESDARLCFAQLLSGIDYLHSRSASHAAFSSFGILASSVPLCKTALAYTELYCS